MAYRAMKKVIENANKRLENGEMTQEEYDLFKQDSLNKLDVFLACNRITITQYEELEKMLK